jgi:hypothetical protein
MTSLRILMRQHTSLPWTGIAWEQEESLLGASPV